MIKSVVFDLDGTLLDTSEGVFSSVLKMVEELNYRPLTESELRSFIGPPIRDTVVKIYGVSREEGMDAMNIFRKYYVQGDIYKGIIYPGLKELLIKLHESGIKVGVATYKREDQAKALLEEKGLAPLFDVIHGADPYGKLTKADVVALSIKDLGHAPEETVMIGDSDNDAIGASGAGALFIGVTYGFGFTSKADVDLYDNIGVSEDCAGIYPIIETFNNNI